MDLKQIMACSIKKIAKREIEFIDFFNRNRRVIFILVDEVEKAHMTLHNMFLNILDTGIITMGDNSKSNLKHSVIFFTSNLGNKELEEAMQKKFDFVQTGQKPYSPKKFELIFKKFFPPEYRGRIKKLFALST